jgi:heme-degrading monooxygenase HmoA
MADNTETGADARKAIFINVFTIPQGKESEELIAMLRDITRDVMQPKKGFRSSKLHLSIDKERVVVYSEWDSEDDFRKIWRLPEAREQLEKITRDFPRDPRFYTIVDVFLAEGAQAHQ